MHAATTGIVQNFTPSGFFWYFIPYRAAYANEATRQPKTMDAIGMNEAPGRLPKNVPDHVWNWNQLHERMARPQRVDLSCAKCRFPWSMTEYTISA